MKNIARIFSKKIGLAEREDIMVLSARFINRHTNPIKIIFFGSIVTDGFYSDSDVDLLAIYKTQKEADEARRVLYTSTQPQLNHSLEMICVDEATFERKADMGGICFVAQSEGRVWS